MTDFAGQTLNTGQRLQPTASATGHRTMALPPLPKTLLYADPCHAARVVGSGAEGAKSKGKRRFDFTRFASYAQRERFACCKLRVRCASAHHWMPDEDGALKRTL